MRERLGDTCILIKNMPQSTQSSKKMSPPPAAAAAAAAVAAAAHDLPSGCIYRTRRGRDCGVVCYMYGAAVGCWVCLGTNVKTRILCCTLYISYKEKREGGHSCILI